MKEWNLFAYFLLLGALFVASTTSQESLPRMEQRSRNKLEGDLAGKFDVFDKPPENIDRSWNDSIQSNKFPAELSNTTKIHTNLRVRRGSKSTKKRRQDRIKNRQSVTVKDDVSEIIERVPSPSLSETTLVPELENVDPFSHFTLALSYIPTLCFQAKVDRYEFQTKLVKDGKKKEFARRDWDVPCVTYNQWTIHGLWPTKVGEVLEKCYKPNWLGGKEFLHLEPQLKEKWKDIFVVHDGTPRYKNPYKFWNDEWEKHGTCAASVEELNTYDKYFKRAIELFDKYEIGEVRLDGPGLTLDNYIRAIKVHFQFKEELKILVTCYNYKEISYVREVRICLNRDLEPRDCEENPPRRYTCDSTQVFKKGIWGELRRSLPE